MELRQLAGKKLPLLLFVVVGLSFNSLIVLAGPGDYDITFNAPWGHTVYAPAFTARSVAVQGDGKSVVVGSGWNGSDWDLVVVRFRIDGQVDESFGIEGAASFHCQSNQDDFGYGVAIQADGKILVVGKCWGGGSTDALLLRYRPDGSLDPTFGGGAGVVTYDGPGGMGDNFNAVAVQPDGKIVAVGNAFDGFSQNVLVTRYDAAGALDPSFGSGTGVVFWDGVAKAGDFATDLVLQGNGRIVITGLSNNGLLDLLLLLRLQANGNLDPTFGNGSGFTLWSRYEVSDSGTSVDIDTKGRILVAGTSWKAAGNPDLTVWRFHQDGTLDLTFGNLGVFDYHGPADKGDFGESIAVQSDDKIVVVGSVQTFVASILDSDLLVLRLEENGVLDAGFGAGTGVVSYNGPANDADEGFGVALQTDGKILACGSSGNTLTGYAAVDMFVMRLVGEEFTPDLRANGNDGPLQLFPASPLTVTVQMTGTPGATQSGEWWLLALTNIGWFYLSPSLGWIHDPFLGAPTPAFRGPVFGFPQSVLLHVPNAPPGFYMFLFGYEKNQNGILEFEHLIHDTVTVRVLPP